MMTTKKSVTEIIGEIYPFDNRFFLESLSAEGMLKKRAKGDLEPGMAADLSAELNYKELMDILSRFGTTIHQCAFDLGTLGFCHSMTGTVFENHVSGLHKFFLEHEARGVAAETYITTPEYHGISDGIYSLLINGKRQNVLLDFKTWGAYKYLYGIKQKILGKNNMPSIDKEKLEKVSLQLSMYRRGYDLHEAYKDIPIHAYAVVWVTHIGTFLIPAYHHISPFEEYMKKQSALSL